MFQFLKGPGSSSVVLFPQESWVLKDPGSSRVLGPQGSSRVLGPCFPVCPLSNKVEDVKACKFYEIWTLSTGISTVPQSINIKKNLLVFFRKHHRNMLKQNTYSKIIILYEYLKFL